MRFLPRIPALRLSFDAAVPPKKKPVQHEKKFQKLAVDFMDAALPADAVVLVVPGGAARRTRHPGYKKGTPDTFVVWRGRAFFIENKVGRGRPSAEQSALLERLRICGAETAVCSSLEAIETQLRAWGIPLRARVVAGRGAWVLEQAA
jgi:hypothetical protein